MRQVKIPYLGNLHLVDLIIEDLDGYYWLLCTEYGPSVLCKSTGSYESVFDSILDEMPTIPEEDLYEAYGFDDLDEYEAYLSDCEEGLSSFPDLTEGYYYQTNFTGTGIVWLSYYWSLRLYKHSLEKEALVKW